MDLEQSLTNNEGGKMNKPTKILIIIGLCGFILYFVIGNILFFIGMKPENESNNSVEGNAIINAIDENVLIN